MKLPKKGIGGRGQYGETRRLFRSIIRSPPPPAFHERHFKKGHVPVNKGSSIDRIRYLALMDECMAILEEEE